MTVLVHALLKMSFSVKNDFLFDVVAIEIDSPIWIGFFDKNCNSVFNVDWYFELAWDIGDVCEAFHDDVVGRVEV